MKSEAKNSQKNLNDIKNRNSPNHRDKDSIEDCKNDIQKKKQSKFLSYQEIKSKDDVKNCM